MSNIPSSATDWPAFLMWHSKCTREEAEDWWEGMQEEIEQAATENGEIRGGL